ALLLTSSGVALLLTIHSCVSGSKLPGSCAIRSPDLRELGATAESSGRGFSGLEVDDQLELRGLLDGKIGRFRAFEDLIHVARSTSVQIWVTRTVRHETTSIYHLPVPVDRGQAAPHRQLYQSNTLRCEEGAIQLEQRVRAHRFECRVKVS